MHPCSDFFSWRTNSSKGVRCGHFMQKVSGKWKRSRAKTLSKVIGGFYYRNFNGRALRSKNWFTNLSRSFHRKSLEHARRAVCRGNGMKTWESAWCAFEGAAVCLRGVQRRPEGWFGGPIKKNFQLLRLLFCHRVKSHSISKNLLCTDGI